MDTKLLKSTNMCRTCLTEASSYKSLLSKMETDDRTICEVLSFITSLDITMNDRYPGQVCEFCYSIICKADEFKKKCIQSENSLKNIFDTFSIKDELSNKLTQIENQDYLNFFNNSKVEVPIIDSLDLGEYKYNNLNTIKEEDDFRDDLGDSIVIENMPIESVSPTKICICGYICGDESELLLHAKECKSIKLENLKNEPSQYLKAGLSCPICKENFENWSLYAKHLKTHKKKKNGTIPLSCPECEESFPDMMVLGLHIMEKHRYETNEENELKEEKVKNFECSMCMRRFVMRKSLIAHIKKHEATLVRSFKCETCGRDFQHQAHLDNHVVLVHSKDKVYTCNKCKKCFASQDQLNQHIEGHQKAKNHECCICNKYFSMLSSLTEHMRTHTGEKPFLCSVCGKGFSQKNNMTQHMRRHQGLKPFKCEHCDRRFVSKGELESHARRHSGAHPFICDECGNGFTTSSSLTKHRRIHSGERPYACDLCNMRFAVLGTLKNHRRTHTGEKPYQCSHCEKAFIQRQDLISHIRCHTGERPFICTCCGQGFRKTSALKVHIKIHGKEGIVMQ